MMIRDTAADWIVLALYDLVVCSILAACLVGGFILVRALLVRALLIRMGLYRAGKKELKVVAVPPLARAQGAVAYVFVTQIMPEDGFSLEREPVVGRQ